MQANRRQGASKQTKERKEAAEDASHSKVSKHKHGGQPKGSWSYSSFFSFLFQFAEGQAGSQKRVEE
jgi:hypothetical protein